MCTCDEINSCSECKNPKFEYSDEYKASYTGREFSVNKKLVVAYIDVGNLVEDQVENYINKIKDTLKLDNTDTIQWFIPIRQGFTRVETFDLR